MNFGDYFGAREDQEQKEAQQRHAERLYRTYLAAGWDETSAKRCAERDAEAGLYLMAFGPDEK